MTIADKHLQVLWERLQSAGQMWDMGSKTYTQSDITNVADRKATIVLPEQCGQIKYVEARVGSHYFELASVELYNREMARRGVGGMVGWMRVGSGRLGGKIELYGGYTKLTDLVVHYGRRWAPLHYGKADAATTTTLTFDTATSPVTVSGSFPMRDDVFTGMELEITDGAAVDQLAPIISYTAGVATFDPIPSLTGTPTYALLVPLKAEYTGYLVELIVHECFARLGNPEYLQASMLVLAQSNQEFVDSISRQDEAKPLHVYNSRVRS